MLEWMHKLQPFILVYDGVCSCEGPQFNLSSVCVFLTHATHTHTYLHIHFHTYIHIYIYIYIHIQVDNPVAILNQEISKTFLAQSSPRMKYELFYRGTQLKQISDDLMVCPFYAGFLMFILLPPPTLPPLPPPLLLPLPLLLLIICKHAYKYISIFIVMSISISISI